VTAVTQTLRHGRAARAHLTQIRCVPRVGVWNVMSIQYTTHEGGTMQFDARTMQTSQERRTVLRAAVAAGAVGALLASHRSPTAAQQTRHGS